MNLENLMSAIFLIAVLILVLPGFLETNSKLNRLLKNLSIWSIVILLITVVSYLII